MGDVLELTTIRSPLDRLLIRTLGPAEGDGWRRVGFNRQFRDGVLFCRPHLVLSDRRGVLAISTLWAGPTPPQLAHALQAEMLLTCAVVGRELERADRYLLHTEAWARFEDGGSHRVVVPRARLSALAAEAHAFISRRGLGDLSTANLARLMR